MSNPFFEDNPFETEAPTSAFEGAKTDDAFDAEEVFGGSSSSAFADNKVAKEVVSTENVDFFEAAFEEEKQNPESEKNKKSKKNEKQKLAPPPSASMASESEESSSSSSESDSEEQQKQKKKKKKKKFRCYHLFRLKFYRKYFQVDTTQFLKRMLFSMWPFGENFLNRVNPNPDFYGPFWITTTCIFVLALVSNCIAYGKYAAKDKTEDFSYDWVRITVTLIVMYSYMIAAPVIAWGVQKYLGGKLRLIEWFCVYGYGFTIYLPIGLLCLISIEWVLWILVFAACAISTINLLFTFWPHLSDQINTAGRLGISIFMITMHVGLALFLKLYLFLPVAIKVETDTKT